VRIVLDTNVLISGIFFSGPPHRILKAWHRGKLTLVISESIFDEYQRVANELSAQFPDIELESILALLLTESELIQAGELKEQVCADPDDDKFLACALAGKCRVVISGDKELLKVSGYRGIEVLRPREFIERFLSEPS
jgi:putative PIN family toxin of toxin-antitoxin system